MVTVIVKSHPATFLTQYSAHPSDYLRYHQKNKIWATLFLLARTVYFYKSQLNLIIKIWRGDIRHRLISEWIFTGVSQTKMIDAFSSVQSIKVSDCFANKLFLFRHFFRGSPTLRSNASVKHGSLSQDYNFESHKWSQIQMKLGWLSRKKNTWHQQIILGHNHNDPQYRNIFLLR